MSVYHSLLRHHNIVIPDELQAPAPPAASGDAANRQSVAELLEELQDKRGELKGNAERISELNRERDELLRQLRACEEERQQLLVRLTDANTEREKVEYEKNEMTDAVERLKHDKQTLLQEIEELHR